MGTPDSGKSPGSQKVQSTIPWAGYVYILIYVRYHIHSISLIFSRYHCHLSLRITRTLFIRCPRFVLTFFKLKTFTIDWNCSHYLIINSYIDRLYATDYLNIERRFLYELIDCLVLQVVIDALQFLAAVALQKYAKKNLFANPAVMDCIFEKLILPNIEIRGLIDYYIFVFTRAIIINDKIAMRIYK